MLVTVDACGHRCIKTSHTMGGSGGLFVSGRNWASNTSKSICSSPRMCISALYISISLAICMMHCLACDAMQVVEVVEYTAT